MELDFRLYTYQLWARFPAYFELKTVTKGLKPSVFGVAYLGDLAALACFPWVWYYLDLLLYTRPTSARFYAYVELDLASISACLELKFSFYIAYFKLDFSTAKAAKTRYSEKGMFLKLLLRSSPFVYPVYVLYFTVKRLITVKRIT